MESLFGNFDSYFLQTDTFKSSKEDLNIEHLKSICTQVNKSKIKKEINAFSNIIIDEYNKINNEKFYKCALDGKDRIEVTTIRCNNSMIYKIIAQANTNIKNGIEFIQEKKRLVTPFGLDETCCEYHYTISAKWGYE